MITTIHLWFFHSYFFYSRSKIKCNIYCNILMRHALMHLKEWMWSFVYCINCHNFLFIIHYAYTGRANAGGVECGSNIICRVGGVAALSGIATGVIVVTLLILVSLFCLCLLRWRLKKSRQSQSAAILWDIELVLYVAHWKWPHNYRDGVKRKGEMGL